MIIVVFEKFSKTYHMVDVKESKMTDEARRFSFNSVREKLKGQKTWLIVKDSFIIPDGTGNCFEGDLTGQCSKCKYWMDGIHSDSVGCGAPFPIGHCPAFKAFDHAKSAIRKYEWIVDNCNSCDKRFNCEYLRSGEYWWCTGVDDSGDIPDGNDDYYYRYDDYYSHYVDEE